MLSDSREIALVAPAADRGSDLAAFHRTLAEMCRAGVPLPRALRLLAKDGPGRGIAREAVRMAGDVELGVAFPDTYAQTALPPVYATMIDAGIAAGDLPAVLDEIAEHASFRARVAERMRHALAYPMLMAVFVVLTGARLGGVLSPVFDFGVGLPRQFAFRQSLITSPGFAMMAGAGVLVLFVAACLAFTWLRNPLDGAGPRRLAFRLPVFGRVRTLAAKASFASTLALLARRRVPLPRALQLAAATAEDPAISEQIAAMATAAAGGANLTESVREGDLIAPSLLWLVESAESTGTAAAALGEVAGIYRQRLERAVDRRAVLAGPIAELIIGAVILMLALAFALPSFRFMDAFFGGVAG